MKQLATKQDLDNLEDKIDEVIKENNVLKEEINKQKTINEELKMKLDILENKMRRKNLIFNGVIVSQNLKATVQNLCKNLVGE